ncbi:ABC-type spermidine/putrescine transport system, ATPase component [Rubellimicrobium thermophilum DSM 16684]|uniref:ABC-type spermidine/putrescine transport system, ATPase component n=1 Tax=Rubellimicrobium thermophilum DSM 16684 TaxID=1123069 RepID=S9SBU2_9RHOB|nr:ABC transporter ATP-binding protein [Rubellimicrobium thermophilum]EPX83694.1 ABC-type spermidine/putrescine transport system, ATPase component [Rubellimicrobium thermophilum DSM 16684]
MIPPFLHINGLRKTYGPVVATEHVELSIKEGEFMTFLGPSGSGKSTTLYILAGFQDPDTGDIRLRGRSILGVPSHKRNIGMVFQRYTLFPHLSVGENVAFPLRVRRLPQAEITRKVRRALELVRLGGFEERKPASLSGGQQQRVALARALVYDPPVLLMDEPLSALDKKLREEIQYEIRRIHRETGVTILYVTHDQEEALRLSDRIAIFNAGRIEQVGTGAELYTSPATHFVADFIGDSSFLDGTIAAVEGRCADLRLGDGTLARRIPLHAPGRPGQRAELMLRPERIELSPDPGPDGASLPVLVQDVTFLGNITDVVALTAWNAPVTVRLGFMHPLSGRLTRGDRLWIRWAAETVHAFPRD